jgi:hypothetical protein
MMERTVSYAMAIGHGRRCIFGQELMPSISRERNMNILTPIGLSIYGLGYMQICRRPRLYQHRVNVSQPVAAASCNEPSRLALALESQIGMDHEGKVRIPLERSLVCSKG